jgi:tRNA(adenine34) deaminase
MESTLKSHINYMDMALQEAKLASHEDEVPIGAVLVSEHGEILAMSHNEKEHHYNPCGHAEILVIERAAKEIKSWRLLGATLYVTLEPCPMCLSAMVHARIKNLVFGAYDRKGGALSLGYNLHNDTRLNHNFAVIGGVRHFECSKILSDFFRSKRKSYVP